MCTLPLLPTHPAAPTSHRLSMANHQPRADLLLPRLDMKLVKTQDLPDDILQHAQGPHPEHIAVALAFDVPADLEDPADLGMQYIDWWSDQVCEASNPHEYIQPNLLSINKFKRLYGESGLREFFDSMMRSGHPWHVSVNTKQTLPVTIYVQQ